ncbi:hypothetical protein H0486_04495 [Lachnospiraceae bacterium MD1]|jgi:hypothetical protein|uniref:Uncharacterized protein n=1 Tax=Variimorphobacter saccharofermentans TaxID=2755051 RepID=A0A839JWS4_9FIRM|nr:permease prefix domain 1-containing protein [Variimorphobacter saccharofermentans]MBB2182133.1 hypothetical protein [Variimorphobacter saccharofermentans]
MNDKLRRYIDNLFIDVPQTKSMIELKEEMLQNLIEKYQDLIAEGKSEEAAYNIAIAGIGDISSLIKDMDCQRVSNVNIEAARQKAALLTSVSVMLYILSIVPLLVSLRSGHLFYGLVGVVVMITLATGVIIYNGMTKPRLNSGDQTMVEEFREWQSEKFERGKARISISFAVWSILVVIYLIVSFLTFAWYITWIVFIIGVAIEALINVYFIWKK